MFGLVQGAPRFQGSMGSMLPSRPLIVVARLNSDHQADSLLRTERGEEGSHFVAISAFRCTERMVITLYGIDRSLSPRRVKACACCESAKHGNFIIKWGLQIRIGLGAGSADGP